MMTVEFKCRFYPEYIIAGSRRGAFCLPVEYQNIYRCPRPTECPKTEALQYQRYLQARSSADHVSVTLEKGAKP